MGSIIKWFEDAESNGYIEYKGNDVFIYCSTIEGKIIKLQLTKIKENYKLVSINA